MGGLLSSPASGAGFTVASVEELLERVPALTVPPASPALASARVLIIGGSIGGAAAAACLRAAGFRHVQVVERSEGLQAGAGIGMDEATVAVLKGLGVPLATTATGYLLQRMRWEEERLASGHTVLRQPLPYFAARYAQLQQGLIQRLPADSVSFGRKAVRLEKLGGCDDHPDGTVRVHFASGEPIDCDFCVCVDGPRSGFRQLLQLEDSGKELRFAGYTGWRGVVNEVDLPQTARDALHAMYPLYGNCLYFIMSECGRGHAVLYDLGDGLLNWLIYELRPQGPVAEPGRTTSAASSADVRRLHSEARRVWGDALGAVIEATPEPFWNDIYDIAEPLESFAATEGPFAGCAALLGDAAHPVTPHMAKGSNMAVHDAFTLAAVASTASTPAELLASFSAARAQETKRCVLLSRHLGWLRNGQLGMSGPPRDEATFLELLSKAKLPTRTLPVGGDFEALWRHVEAQLPQEQRGYFLQREESGTLPVPVAALPGSLEVTQVNHVSRETQDVARLARFYEEVLGFERLPRPNFGFGGVWLRLPGSQNQSLHIIEADPELTELRSRKPLAPAPLLDSWLLEGFPERHIRRSHHIALTVPDIEKARSTLQAHGLRFAENRVPGKPVVQLFLFDPDGNGVEIGNFDAR